MGRWGQRYRFLLNEDGSFIKIWDIDKAAYGEFKLHSRGSYGTRVLFKGIEVAKNTPILRHDGISSTIDIYGMDTKETITLDRSSLTRNGPDEVARILSDMLDVYMECILDKLTNEPNLATSAIFTSSDFSLYKF